MQSCDSLVNMANVRPSTCERAPGESVGGVWQSGICSCPRGHQIQNVHLHNRPRWAWEVGLHSAPWRTLWWKQQARSCFATSPQIKVRLEEEEGRRRKLSPLISTIQHGDICLVWDAGLRQNVTDEVQWTTSNKGVMCRSCKHDYKEADWQKEEL